MTVMLRCKRTTPVIPARFALREARERPALNMDVLLAWGHAHRLVVLVLVVLIDVFTVIIIGRVADGRFVVIVVIVARAHPDARIESHADAARCRPRHWPGIRRFCPG